GKKFHPTGPDTSRNPAATAVIRNHREVCCPSAALLMLTRSSIAQKRATIAPSAKRLKAKSHGSIASRKAKIKATRLPNRLRHHHSRRISAPPATALRKRAPLSLLIPVQKSSHCKP